MAHIYTYGQVREIPPGPGIYETGQSIDNGKSMTSFGICILFNDEEELCVNLA